MICLICNLKFIGKRRKSRIRTFCSYQCYWQWLKGRKQSLETKIKHSLALKLAYKEGRRKPNGKHPNSIVKGLCKYCKKIYLMPNHRKKYSIFCTKNCYSLYQKSEEGREYIRKYIPRGEEASNWKGGITPLRKKMYFSKEYKLWRNAVFERDDWTCRICLMRGKTLNVDHVKSWAEYPKLRYKLENGRTLCIDCHRKTPTYGGRTQINT